MSIDEKKRRRFEDAPAEGAADGLFTSQADSSATADQSQSLKLLQQIIGLVNPEDIPRLLARAAMASPEALKLVCEEAGKDRQNRKIFVRGLSFDTTSEGLNKVFSPFGRISEHTVIKDKTTGKSRGFGFVTYYDMESVYRALQEPNKSIDGRTSVSQMAVLGTTRNTNASQGEDVLLRKIFVANVHGDISGDRLREFFSQFGEIDEGPIGFDRTTKRSRGYALFVFRTIEGAQRALAEPSKVVDGHQVFCKLAGDPKGKAAPNQQMVGGAYGGAQDPYQQGVLQQPEVVASQQGSYYQASAYSSPYAQQAALQAAQQQHQQQQQQQQQQALYTIPATAVNGAGASSQTTQYYQTATLPGGTPVYVAATPPQAAAYLSQSPAGQAQAAAYLSPSQAGQAQAAAAGGGAYYVTTAVPGGPAGYTLVPAGAAQSAAGMMTVAGQQQQAAARAAGQGGAGQGQPALVQAQQGYYQALPAGGQQGGYPGAVGLSGSPAGAYGYGRQ